MTFGIKEFSGDAGKHSNEQGQDCAGRFFEVKLIGVGALLNNN
jgi:hypothetical protein